jgi:hypothetical protein
MLRGGSHMQVGVARKVSLGGNPHRRPLGGAALILALQTSSFTV